MCVGLTHRKTVIEGNFYCVSFSKQRSLAGYSLWGHKEPDMTERLALLDSHVLQVMQKINKTPKQK